jgi:hypothetical protein
VELGAAAAARDGGGESWSVRRGCGERRRRCGVGRAAAAALQGAGRWFLVRDDGGGAGTGRPCRGGAPVTGRRCRGAGRRPGRARWPARARAVASGGGERAVVAGKIASVEKKRPTRALKETMRDFYSEARRQDLWRRAPVHVGASSAATSALGAGIRSCHVTARRHRLWRRTVLPRRHSL